MKKIRASQGSREQKQIAILFSQNCKTWCAGMELAIKHGATDLVTLFNASGLCAPYFLSKRRKRHQKLLLDNNAINSPHRSRLMERIGFLQIHFIIRKFIEGRRIKKFPRIILGDYDITSIVHCKIAANRGSRFFLFHDVNFFTFYRYSAIAIKSLRFAKRVFAEKYELLYVYNGRDIIEATFVLVAKSYDCKVVFVERGALKASFQLFDVSPHYHPNWWKLIQNQSAVEIGKEELKAIDRFKDDKLKGIDTYKRESWNQNYEEGDYSQWGNFALFLSSSTTEFSPFDEYNYESGFTNNKFEAILFLARALKKKNMNLVIRRHPNSVGYDWVDREESHWSKVRGEPNVFYISPYDRISSYSLIRASQRVYVWKSSIGFESLLLKKPTFCLASAKWAWEEDFQLKTFSQIEESLDRPFDSDLATKTIFSYANFMSNSGDKSKLFEFFDEHKIGLLSGEIIPNLSFQYLRSGIEKKFYDYIVGKPKKKA